MQLPTEDFAVEGLAWKQVSWVGQDWDDYWIPRIGANRYLSRWQRIAFYHPWNGWPTWRSFILEPSWNFGSDLS